nr:MAG TPA: hypothetical protein [Caudoviricetes sp.]
MNVLISRSSLRNIKIKYCISRVRTNIFYISRFSIFYCSSFINSNSSIISLFSIYSTRVLYFVIS